ncbi:hypothetical protein [Cryptosporangium japonicum]|uniref:Uncharacterized protein n=1 Tax=Cryptosporangium japonicum TaxID=80872 RepID=A0ABN0USF4_9ACTN
MRGITRVVAALAVAASALVTLTATPATAAAPSAFPNTVPTAALTGITVLFGTQADNKDRGSYANITILTKTGAVAGKIFDHYYEFDENTSNGPFPFLTTPGSRPPI